MATETVSIDSSNALADDFINFFNISKPIENDTQKPHPKFATYCRKFSSVDNGVKRLQEKRRQEMLENLKRFVLLYSIVRLYYSIGHFVYRILSF